MSTGLRTSTRLHHHHHSPTPQMSLRGFIYYSVVWMTSVLDNVLDSQKIADSDTLNRKFSVIPETLSTSNGTVAPTINNEAGSLLMSPSSALPPEDFMSKLAEEL